jgi:hypothetical protein
MEMTYTFLTQICMQLWDSEDLLAMEIMMILDVRIEQLHPTGSLECATCAIHTSLLEDIGAITGTQAHTQSHTSVYLLFSTVRFPHPLEVVLESDSLIQQDQAIVAHTL